MRQLKAADLLGNRASKGALFVAEQLAFQEPRRDGSAVELDESPVPPRTQIVKGASDQLLARARLPADEHGRARRCDSLDLLQHPAESGALPNNLIEIVIPSDLLPQVEILLGQPVFQFGDLLVSLHVLTRERKLISDFTKKTHVGRRILACLPTNDGEHADAVASHDQGNSAIRPHPLGREPYLIRILLLLFEVAMDKGLLVLKHPSKTALCAFELAPGHEVIRARHRFHPHQPESVLIRNVK